MSRAPRLLLVPGLALALALAASGVAAAARADTVTLPPGSGLPWTDPQHRGPLEQLAGRIATHIAGRPVTIRCEGDTDWLKLTTERGVDPGAELGYVGVEVYSRGGQITNVVTAGFAELSTGTCAALQAFALADPKPTTCRPPVSSTSTVLRPRRVATRVKVDLGPDPKHPGKRRTVIRTVWKTVQVPATVTSQVPGPSVPCYLEALTDSAPRFAVDQSRASQRAYEDTTEAMLTLAHEAVHLGGAVGGATFSGLAYGDQLAEARAECSGLQWLPYVAQQLGASAADALAIAQLEVRWLYPLRNEPGGHAEYWSADCVPGGALDIRADRTAPWPSGLG
jgi:hypothetical protein